MSKANEAQESNDWKLARVGMFTASRSADLMARTKSGPSASRGNLIAQLVAERMTGEPTEAFQNDAMRRGTELEAEARDAYMFATGNVVVESGFIVYADLPRTGCSPDGMIGETGLVEIKCPSAMGKHLAALLRGDHASEYRWQLQHQLLVTGRKWVDIASYDPRWPDDLQLAIKRVERDEDAIQQLRDAITEADAEVEAFIAALQQRAA